MEFFSDCSVFAMLLLALLLFGLFSVSLAASVRRGCEMLLKAKAAVERGEKRRDPVVRGGCEGDMMVALLLEWVRSVVVVEVTFEATGGAKSLAVAGEGADSRVDDIVMIRQL